MDQEHALAMREALVNLNADLVQKYPDYVVRIVADEEEVGRGHLDRFADVETTTPTLVTTSRLLSTGLDVPTCQNIVLARVVGSMTEFKQIIGRGTRVRADYDKYFFTILDYTGSATQQFADPQFDGQPAYITQEEVDSQGQAVAPAFEAQPSPMAESHETVEAFIPEQGKGQIIEPETKGTRRKYYKDDGYVEISADIAYEMDAKGNQLRAVQFTDYTAEQVRTLFPSAAQLRSRWTKSEERSRIIRPLEERGITFEHLAQVTRQTDADPFDLLCNVAYSTPLRSRRERAEQLRKNKADYFQKCSEDARQILTELLNKYIEYGIAEFRIPEVLKLPPISSHGNPMEISKLFGGPDKLRLAVEDVQSLLYAA